MIPRRLIFVLALALLPLPLFGAKEQDKEEESDQQINDFSLAGYEEKGKKAWDLAGKSADIFTDIVKLKDVTGNLYGEKEDTRLTADRGNFDKARSKIHMEQNVVITTSSGSKLTTDSLDWDRKNQVVTTEDLVNIYRENMVTTGVGAEGQMALNNVTLKKDVKVEIKPDAKDAKSAADQVPVVITCDGPLQIDYGKNIAVFNKNVKVDREGSQIYSDEMEIYFGKSAPVEGEAKPEKDAGIMGSKIDKIVSRGNVRIIRGENVSYSDEAVYTAVDKKITLSGKPKIVLYSMEDFNAPVGD